MLGVCREAGGRSRNGQLGIQLNRTWPRTQPSVSWVRLTREVSAALCSPSGRSLDAFDRGRPHKPRRASRRTDSAQRKDWGAHGGCWPSHFAPRGGSQALPLAVCGLLPETVTRGHRWRPGAGGGRARPQGAWEGCRVIRTGGCSSLHTCTETGRFYHMPDTTKPSSAKELSLTLPPGRGLVAPPPAFALAKPWVTRL